MNYAAVLRMLGFVLQFEAGFLLLPCIVALIYREKCGFAYLIMAAVMPFFPWALLARLIPIVI